MLLLSYMALTLGGCGLFQGSQDSSEDPPVAQPPQPPEEKPEEVFDETPTPSASQPPAAGGLIPSTPPSDRRREIKPGRNNPFAVIPVKPVIREKTAENNVGDPERLCMLEEVKIPPTTVAQAPDTNTPVSDMGLPPLLDPILPVPNEARGVVVSGVMQLQGTPVAIVKAPNENVARQVTVGASLSNGQIIVKAINVAGDKPSIVLEQYGLEVTRGVGEPAEEPVEPPTPVAPNTDGTPQPTAGKPQIPAPAGPNGFGIVKNLILEQVELTGEDTPNPLINGILCNNGRKTVKVSTIILQIVEKETNKVINSMTVELAATYTLEPGVKAEFDGRVGANDQSQKSELGLRGRNKEDVTITLTDWS